jgi:hypothetical protein
MSKGTDYGEQATVEASFSRKAQAEDRGWCPSVRAGVSARHTPPMRMRMRDAFLTIVARAYATEESVAQQDK